MHRIRSLASFTVLVWALLAVVPARAQPGWVLAHQKISDTEGGFTGILEDLDVFGTSVVSLGDLDGDGVGDLAVGAQGDDDGGNGPCDDSHACNRGAVWVLFLNMDGTVKAHQKISDTEGGFTGILDDGDLFGRAVASLGDLDGDGVGDLAVGAALDDDGSVGACAPQANCNRGAVWVLFLNPDGTVKSHQKVSDTEGGFTGTLEDGDRFGISVTALGDLDGDGVTDLAVGAAFDDDEGPDRGAVWVLFLDTDGTVKSHQKISDTEGGFTGILDNGDFFGDSVVSLGDLDGDGVDDLAVGAHRDDDGGSDRGAVWVLFLDTDGTVKSHQKISDTEGGFTGVLGNGDQFGVSLAPLGDLDGDGVGDLGVGAPFDNDGGGNRGALWLLFMNTDGTVRAHQKISDTEGGFTGTLDNTDWFGVSLGSLGDLDGDGVRELVVGARQDNDGSPGPCDTHLSCDRGAVWVLFLDSVPQFIPLPLDIKPRFCPNGITRGANAAVWVGLLGTRDFDITQVDSSMVMLSRADGVGEAISPQGNPRFKDVATPFEGKLCDCHTAGKDGILDLRAKFKTADMEAAFGFDAEPTGTVIELTLTGALLDGTPFQANDCITIDR